MGFFDRFLGGGEEREERREEYLEERAERGRYGEDDEWELAGSAYDPYSHGEMFYDPALGHHGVMRNGTWHPLEQINGLWSFVHPSRFGVQRGYRPTNLTPARQMGAGQPQARPGIGAYGVAPAGSITCPHCQAVQPAGTHFCASCGNDLRAVAAAGANPHCTQCGASLAPGARFCASCGAAQS